MWVTLIYATALLCTATLVATWGKYKDVFHPLILITPMFGFVYVYMPLRLVADGGVYSYVTEDQCVFYQLAILLGLSAFIAACFRESAHRSRPSARGKLVSYDQKKLQQGAYLLGAIGLACWLYCL